MWLPPPGVTIVLLGALAIAAPLLRPNPTANEKRIWIIVVVVLTIVEIWAILRERRRQDQQFAVILQGFTELPQTTAAAVVAGERLREADAAHLARASLKRRALALSHEILQFLLDREQTAPYAPMRRPSHADTAVFQLDPATIVAYMNQTVSQFSQQFLAQVKDVREELARHGKTDAALDRYLASLVNPLTIRLAAERLGALAGELP
jgi:hypothetical protein